MKSLVLAAAIVALAVPAALAKSAPEQKAADATQAQSDVPDGVKTYVRKHAGDPFPYSGGQIRIGEKVDAGEVWRPIPDFPQYLWSNLAGQLVVIDSKTSRVAAIF